MATTLKSRFVGVTAGLGTRSRSSWIGSRNTAPETPTGAVRTATSSPAPNANRATGTLTAQILAQSSSEVRSIRPGSFIRYPSIEVAALFRHTLTEPARAHVASLAYLVPPG